MIITIIIIIIIIIFLLWEPSRERPETKANLVLAIKSKCSFIHNHIDLSSSNRFDIKNAVVLLDVSLFVYFCVRAKVKIPVNCKAEPKLDLTPAKAYNSVSFD